MVLALLSRCSVCGGGPGGGGGWWMYMVALFEVIVVGLMMDGE